MTQDDLADLQALHDAASAAPWHVVETSDNMCMSAVMVTREPPGEQGIPGFAYDVEAEDVIAACLLQSPPVATSGDERWDANARLIAAMRNAMPELLRLARRGLDAEHGDGGSA